MAKNRFRSFLKIRKLSKKIASIQAKPKAQKKEETKSEKLEEKLQPEKKETEEVREEIIVDLQKKEYDLLKPLKEKKQKKEGELEEIVSDAPAPEKKESEKDFRGYDTKKVGYDLQKNLYGRNESPDEEDKNKLYEHRGVTEEATTLYETPLQDRYGISENREIKTESHELYSDITKQKKKRGIF